MPVACQTLSGRVWTGAVSSGGWRKARTERRTGMDRCHQKDRDKVQRIWRNGWHGDAGRCFGIRCHDACSQLFDVCRLDDTRNRLYFVCIFHCRFGCHDYCRIYDGSLGHSKNGACHVGFDCARYDLPVLIRVQHEFCVGILCVLRAYDEPAENASVSFDFYGIRHKGLCRNLCVFESVLPDWCSGRLCADKYLAGHLGIWHHVDGLCGICNLAVLLRDGCTVQRK